MNFESEVIHKDVNTMMNNDMNTSTRKKVNKEWGIEEERYARTAPGFTKRKLRKRDTLPIIFIIALLAIVGISAWKSNARADEIHHVVFDANGGDWGPGEGDEPIRIQAFSVDTGTNVSAPSPAPEYAGYNLLGWYEATDSSAYFDFTNTPITQDTTFMADWELIPAVAPVITHNLSDLNLVYGNSTGNTLRVEVSPVPGYDFDFQWYTISADPETTDLTSWTQVAYTAVQPYYSEYSVPTDDIGTDFYCCRVTATRQDNREAAYTDSFYSTVAVSKRVITVDGIKGVDRSYVEGDTTAELDYSDVRFVGALDTDLDSLAVEGTGTFANDAIGSNKTVTISNLELTNDVGGRYELNTASSQKTATATIDGGTVTPVLTVNTEKTYTYKGSAIIPEYTVTLDGKTFPTSNYTVECENNVNAGTATITVSKAEGSLYDFADLVDTYTIAKAPATVVSVTLGSSLTYDKTMQTQEVRSVSVGGVALDSEHWTVRGTTNKSTDAGNHELIIDISGDSNVDDGMVKKVFTIAPKEVTVSGITAGSKPYDGKTDAVLDYSGASFNGKIDGDTLSIASATGEYTSKNAGTGISVKISNIRLGGSSAANYKVSSASQTSTTGSITAIEATPSVSVSGTYVYTGKAIKPTDITLTVSGQTLEKTDYSITGYEDNINAGTATVYVSSKAKGNYSFSSVGGTFTIQQATSLSPSPKTTLTLKSTATATKVGDISVTALSVNAAKWAWRSSDEGISLVSETAAATSGTGASTAQTVSQPVTVRATLEYIGDDAANYVDSVKSVVVTITKEGGTAAKGTSVTGSAGTGSSATGTRTGTTGTSTRSSTTSSRTSSSSGSTSTRTGSSSGSTSTRSGSSSRTGSGSSASSGSSSASEAKPPFIEGAPDLSGWEAIQLRIDGTAIGDSIPVYMNGSTKVPSDVLNSFKGRNVTLVLDMGNSIKWNINGACISQDVTGDLDFAITTNTKAIPTELVDMVSATDYKMQIHLEHSGDFQVAPILTLNLGANNAGLYANLFYYNESANALEYMTADQISEDGTASLTFTHASDYVIIVDKEILANVAVHLDKPETTTIEDNTEKAGTAPISSIADPNSMQAYVQEQPMEETHEPKSAAVARRIVAPEAKKGLRVFWILLILIAALVGVNTYLFMNREELKAAASSRASKKALSKSSSKAAVSSGQKNLKKIQKANNKKFKKYL